MCVLEDKEEEEGGGCDQSWIEQISKTKVKPQRIVAQRLLSRLQYQVSNVSRLQRI